MNVNGIGTSEYPAGYDTKKAERKAAEGNFANQAAQVAGQVRTVALHGAEEGSGDTTISSWADVSGGTSISVYSPSIAMEI